MEVTAKVYSTKKLWVSSGGYNHSIDFSWKTNTLHGHLFPNFFCNSTQSNYIPKKWKQSSNIWTLNSDRIQFHWTLSNHIHTSGRWTAVCLFLAGFFLVQTLDVDSEKKLIYISNDLVWYQTVPWKIMALLMIHISKQGWKYISMLQEDLTL